MVGRLHVKKLEQVQRGGGT